MSPRIRNRRPHPDNSWYKLDNAGKIYPALLSRRTTSLFRISVSLRDPISLEHLRQAVAAVMPRFPYYQVTLRPGFFWYFLETNPRFPQIEGDSLFPCMSMPLKRRGMFLFRIRVFRNRIAVEFSHVLTDGTGALTFLKTLTAEYLRRKGISVPDSPEHGIFSLDEHPAPEEYEDAFRKNFNRRLPPPAGGARAFHLGWQLQPPGRYWVMTGIVPVSKVRGKSAEFGVSLTEFLIAVLIDSYQEIMRSLPDRKKKPIRMNVPVNLRNLYPSRTMRNFFLSVEPWIDPRLGEYSLGEIAAKVHHYMRYEVDRKFLNQQITRNVKGELNIINRLFPLQVKNIVMPAVYRMMGENNYTSGLSNLGKISLPGAMQDQVERFDFFPPPSTGNRIKCTTLSYGENLHISFGSLTAETELERIFFTSLRKMDIPVKIESNRFY